MTAETAEAVTCLKRMECLVESAAAVSRLPAVPALDWCDLSAHAVGLVAPGLVQVVLAAVDTSGVVTELYATGVHVSLPVSARATPQASPLASPQNSNNSDDVGMLRASLETLQGQRYRPNATRRPDSIECVSFTPTAAPLTQLLRDPATQHVVCGSARLGDSGATLLIYVSETRDDTSPVSVSASLSAMLPLLRRTAAGALGGGPGPREWITPREQEILHQILMGKSVPQIAKEQHRSPHTVHDHVKSLHRKLGAATRGELVSKALGFINAKPLPPLETSAESVELKLTPPIPTPAAAPLAPPANRASPHGSSTPR